MADTRGDIRLGIVGCGKIVGDTYLPALERLEGIRAVALADTDAGRAASMAGRFGIDRHFAGHAEMMREMALDAVAVVTPPDSHEAISREVMEAGLHLWVDKPLAMDEEQADRLVETASSSGVTVMVGFNHRWHAGIEQARAIVQSGRLGPLRAVRSVYTHAHNGPAAQSWHRRRDAGGGVIFNDACHHFDLWRYLLGAEIKQVQALAIDSQDFEDDTCVMTAQLDNGVIGSALFSFSTRPHSEVEIFGERGSLLIDVYRFDGVRFLPRNRLSSSGGQRARDVLRFVSSLPSGFAAMRAGGVYDACYPAMWASFRDCVLSGEEPRCTVRDGRAAVGVVQAVLRSVDSGLLETTR